MSAVDAASSPPPAEFFHDNFEVEELIGSGGFGWVCKATRLIDGQQVAIKCILKDRMPRDAIVRARWERSEGLELWQDGTVVIPLEAFVLRKARHGGVVEYLDLFADANYFYLVMEHHGSPWKRSSAHQVVPMVTPPSPPLTPPTATFPLGAEPSTQCLSSSAMSSKPGRPIPLRRSSALNSLTLTTLEPEISPARQTPMARSMPMMRRSSSSDLFECIEQHSHFNESTARFLFSQITEVVFSLRQRGITHRDLKDENVVVDAMGCVKLVDFGSALVFDPTQPTPLCERFYGTATSASPEVLDHIPYHPFPAEIWSLGVLLHILLTGSAPFPSRQHARMGQRNRQLSAKVSHPAQDLLDRCFIVDVDHRISLEAIRTHPWMKPN